MTTDVPPSGWRGISIIPSLNNEAARTIPAVDQRLAIHRGELPKPHRVVITERHEDRRRAAVLFDMSAAAIVARVIASGRGR